MIKLLGLGIIAFALLAEGQLPSSSVGKWTVNIYTHALTPAKRRAQSKAVDVLFNRTPQQVVVQ